MAIIQSHFFYDKCKSDKKNKKYCWQITNAMNTEFCYYDYGNGNHIICILWYIHKDFFLKWMTIDISTAPKTWDNFNLIISMIEMQHNYCILINKHLSTWIHFVAIVRAISSADSEFCFYDFIVFFSRISNFVI